MKLESQRLGETCIVTLLEERLDALCAAAFRQYLAECVDASCKRLVLDLTHTTFVDSSGLGVLVATLRRLPGPGSLVLCGVAPGVERTLRLARLDRILVVQTGPVAQAVPPVTR